MAQDGRPASARFPVAVWQCQCQGVCRCSLEPGVISARVPVCKLPAGLGACRQEPCPPAPGGRAARVAGAGTFWLLASIVLAAQGSSSEDHRGCSEPLRVLAAGVGVNVGPGVLGAGPQGACGASTEPGWRRHRGRSAAEALGRSRRFLASCQRGCRPLLVLGPAGALDPCQRRGLPVSMVPGGEGAAGPGAAGASSVEHRESAAAWRPTARDPIMGSLPPRFLAARVPVAGCPMPSWPPRCLGQLVSWLQCR